MVTLVPEVVLDISSFLEEARKKKPMFTLDSNLTFMQTPAVKRFKLIIQKGPMAT